MNDEYTEYIYDITCFGEPLEPRDAQSVVLGIERALELEERPVFLEGLAARLTELGTPCIPADTELMLSEVRRRYRELLGITCPRTVAEWVRGTLPGITNRRNNYELCMALELDLPRTADFFRRNFLTQPFNCKSSTDAVFLYCLGTGRGYSAAAELLDRAEGFELRPDPHTSTARIFSHIRGFKDDGEFLAYLSRHCFGSNSSFFTPRALSTGSWLW